MASISINNVNYSGRNVQVVNNVVIIDGKRITTEEKEINISIVGDVTELKVDACTKVDVTGNVQDVKTMSGDVQVGGTVSGNVKTMSGNVRCADVGGSVTTMSGNIRKNN